MPHNLRSTAFGFCQPVKQSLIAASKLSRVAKDPNSPYLTAKLNNKMKAGLAKHLAEEFKGYGQPTAFVFKGTHVDAGATFYDYMIRFGPGSMFKFGVALDKAGKIKSLSFG